MYSLSKSKLRKPAELRIHCDEAGRWPLAWPVTVGCSLAIWKPDLTPYKDSKQLTKKQRDILYSQIKNQSIPSTDALHASLSNSSFPSISSPLPSISFNFLLTSTGRSSAQEIDEQWIIKSIQLACLRGIGELLKTYYHNKLRDELLNSDFWEDILAVTMFDVLFSQPIDENTVLHRQEIPNSYAYLAWLIRDGNHMFWLDQVLNLPVVTIIKGDQKNALISAASIVAKVERDARMTDIASQYPTIISKNTKATAANCIANPSPLTASAHSIDPLIAKISSLSGTGALHASIIKRTDVGLPRPEPLDFASMPLLPSTNPPSFSTSAAHPIFLDRSIGSNNTSNSIFFDTIQTSIHAKNTSNVTHNFSNWSDSSQVIMKFLKIDTIPRNFSKRWSIKKQVSIQI